MIIQPRKFRDSRDLDRIRQIQVAGRKAINGTYYVHPGDLDGWLYYLSPRGEGKPIIYLWEYYEKRVTLSRSD